MADSDARAQILGNLRRNLNRDNNPNNEQSLARLQQPQANLIPARARLPHAEQIELFDKMATAASATVQRVDSLAAVPVAIAEFILRQNLPSDIVMAADDELQSLPWSAQERLRIEYRRAQQGDLVTVTSAFAGIAETGTLMLLSGKQSPSTLNFLPDVNIVVLPTARIVGPYEDAWRKLRQRGALPRTVNLITGPSRSADIEQTLQLGAHGPVQLHIILADN